MHLIAALLCPAPPRSSYLMRLEPATGQTLTLSYWPATTDITKATTNAASSAASVLGAGTTAPLQTGLGQRACGSRLRCTPPAAGVHGHGNCDERHRGGDNCLAQHLSGGELQGRWRSRRLPALVRRKPGDACGMRPHCNLLNHSTIQLRANLFAPSVPALQPRGQGVHRRRIGRGIVQRRCGSGQAPVQRGSAGCLCQVVTAQACASPALAC